MKFKPLGKWVAVKTVIESKKTTEAGIIYNDPALNIAWPSENPILSDKDLAFPCLKEADNNFIYPSVQKIVDLPKEK